MEAANSLGRSRTEMKERAAVSPERSKVWMEPKSRSLERRVVVPVVYYLSRNGHFEHPHFMEVSIPAGQGLYLRDVIKRLNALRGKGMASLYSWSSKRSYKNGFVWHDLCEDDFIYPAHGNEYILKGSELLHLDSSSTSSCQDEPLELRNSSRDDPDILLCAKTRTASNFFDLNEYKVYKNKLKNMDAWTQTESHAIKEEVEEVDNDPTDSRDEVSPPCSSSSSSETMEALMKADGSIVPIDNAGNCSRRRIKTPSALMQLISCGSISVKETGLSLVSHLKGRIPRSMSGVGAKENENISSLSMVELEEKECFSGSLIEMKNKRSDVGGELSGLRRSSSCNAERGLKMEMAEKEIEGIRARCISRKPKAIPSKTEEDPTTSRNSNESKCTQQSVPT